MVLISQSKSCKAASQPWGNIKDVMVDNSFLKFYNGA